MVNSIFTEMRSSSWLMETAAFTEKPIFICKSVYFIVSNQIIGYKGKTQSVQINNHLDLDDQL